MGIPFIRIKRNTCAILTGLFLVSGCLQGPKISGTQTVNTPEAALPASATPVPSSTVVPIPSATVAPRPSATASPSSTATPAPTATPQGTGVAYYFSTSSGDDSRTPAQAKNPATPWKTISKLNSIFSSLNPGDSILFKRGETFYGSINVSKSGISSTMTFNFGAYGSGSNPKISGLTPLTSWTNFGNGIYSTPLTATNLNLVTFNGTACGMGRYPNTGYLNYESHNAKLSITDNQLTSTPSWTGGEVVIRKYRWVLDRHTITDHTGGTLTFSSTNSYGNNSNYGPVDKNGYFIQNHLATLDMLGEWYYNPANSTFYMYFGTASPSAYSVKASTQDNNVVLNTKSYVSFTGLDFEGGNLTGANLIGSNHISFTDCNFLNQGGNSVYGAGVSYVDILRGSVTNSFSNGIYVETNGSFVTVKDVTVSNSGVVPGAARSGDGTSEGIAISGDNIVISNNRVINSGYNAIGFFGSNALVENNYVDTFCVVKDDGAGIYTYTGSHAPYVNRIVRNNIVLNAVGAYAGSEAYYYEAYGKAAGIYLDDYSENVEVSGNTVAHGHWGGIFVHESRNVQLLNNLVYDFDQQLLFGYSDDKCRNVTRTGNQFISRLASQYTLYNSSVLNESAALTGISDNNIYATLLNNSPSIYLTIRDVSTRTLNLQQWQSIYSRDMNSRGSPKVVSSISDIRFEYNETTAPKTITLDRPYISVEGTSYSDKITLQPFKSVVLLKN